MDFQNFGTITKFKKFADVSGFSNNFYSKECHRFYDEHLHWISRSICCLRLLIKSCVNDSNVFLTESLKTYERIEYVLLKL